MDRTLIPLALAAADDEHPIEGRTRLQKMVFLIQQELREQGVLDEDDGYPFFPYDYGPYSADLAEDISDLLGAEHLAETERDLADEGKVRYEYDLKDSGRELVETSDAESVDAVLTVAKEIKQRYNEMALPDVLDEVYADYPEYATDSSYQEE